MTTMLLPCNGVIQDAANFLAALYWWDARARPECFSSVLARFRDMAGPHRNSPTGNMILSDRHAFLMHWDSSAASILSPSRGAERLRGMTRIFPPSAGRIQRTRHVPPEGFISRPMCWNLQWNGGCGVGCHFETVLKFK